VDITLPYPPSVNTYWRAIGRGRVIISKKGREYRTEVVCEVAKQRGTLRPQPLEGRLGVDIGAWMPDKRRRDLDNVLKAALDSMVHAGLMLDDEQIDDLRIRRAGVEKPGRLEVKIVEIK
jgi:crossover junction endodeoxyribonuclease RusA